MGQAVEKIVCCLPAIIKPEKVCATCKDKTKCASCGFEFSSNLPEEIAELVIEFSPRPCAGVYRGFYALLSGFSAVYFLPP
jgi:hypothetical protein